MISVSGTRSGSNAATSRPIPTTDTWKSRISPASPASSASETRSAFMKFLSYWHDTAPVFAGSSAAPVEGHFDVAVIGGGFTGLGAARQLAKAGVNVVVLEAERVGSGASGRNGGHVNNGLAHGFLAAKAELGTERAIALYRAFDASIDTLEAIIAEEGIDCNFRRAGKLKLASKPRHFDAIVRAV